jgi:pyridoxine 5-phosphate synthase
MISLGVNIDHVATVRQARYRQGTGGEVEVLGEPDPVAAAFESELGGADCITVHLREDRRHIQDRDLELLARTVRVKLNLEMAATDPMVNLALGQGLARKPHMATLVPEGRAEVTTEGGLDVRGQLPRLKDIVKRLKDAGVVASAFIDASLPQIEASAQAGFQACEIHTGPYARAFAKAGGSVLDGAMMAELGALATAGGAIRAAGMRFHAGHALDYVNVRRVAAIDGIAELHIGHSIVSRAVFVGMREAVREMKNLMR